MRAELIDGRLWIPQVILAPGVSGDTMVEIDRDHPEWDDWINTVVDPELLKAAGFDPSLHPHQPGGSSKGGQWAPSNAATADDMQAAREERNGPNAKLDDWFYQLTSEDGVDNDFAGDKKLAAREISHRLEADPDWHQESFMKFMDPDDSYVDYFAIDKPDENTTALAIHQWAQSSSDTNLASLLIQQEAAAEFGVEFNVRNIVAGNSMSWPNMMSAVEADQQGAWAEAKLRDADPLARSSARAFVRAQYENTQARLAKMGIEPTDELTLFRGMKLTDRQMDALPLGASKQQIVQRPMSSWSTEYGVAKDFSKGKGTQASAVVAARIPAGRIIGIPGAGAGCLGEFECLVASDSDPDDVTMVSGFHGQDIPESWEEMVQMADWLERNS